MASSSSSKTNDFISNQYSPFVCPGCSMKITGNAPELPCGHQICFRCAVAMERDGVQKCPVEGCRQNQTPFPERVSVSNLLVKPVAAVDNSSFTVFPPPYKASTLTQDVPLPEETESRIMENVQFYSRQSEKIKNNELKKLLVVGKTGSGKSSLCNVLSGYSFNADLFEVSAESRSCTQKTNFRNVFFNGDSMKPISIIDTIGFDDPNKDTDATIISDLVVKLKNDCDYVNLFLITVIGQDPRLDGSLIGMLKVFEQMFGLKFWGQAVIVFTMLPMDNFSLKNRLRIRAQSDAQLAIKYIKELGKHFPKAKGLKYLIVDACRNQENPEDNQAFDKGVRDIWQLLEKAPRLPTESVKNVETEYRKLKSEIEQKENQMKEMQKQQQLENERMKEEIKKMQNQFKKEVETIKAEQDQDRIQMETKQANELKKLAAERDTVRSNLEQKLTKLGNDMAREIVEKKAERENFQKQFDEQNKKAEKLLSEKLDQINLQQVQLQLKFEKEQDSTKLLSKLEFLKKQLEELEEKYSGQIAEQQDKLNQKDKEIENQRQALKVKYEKEQPEELKKWESKISEAEYKLQQQQAEASEKIIKQQKLDEEKINDVKTAQWKNILGAMLKQFYSKGHKNPYTAAREIRDYLSTSYPENWWCVNAKFQSDDTARRLKKGVGESAEWKNIGYSLKYDFLVCTVPIAQLKERGGKFSAEKKRKAKEILESVAELLPEKGNRFSSKIVADELVSRLDKERLNWVHIGVSYLYSTVQPTRSDAISLVNTYVDILDSKYIISIYLTP